MVVGASVVVGAAVVVGASVVVGAAVVVGVVGASVVVVVAAPVVVGAIVVGGAVVVGIVDDSVVEGELEETELVVTVRDLAVVDGTGGPTRTTSATEVVAGSSGVVEVDVDVDVDVVEALGLGVVLARGRSVVVVASSAGSASTSWFAGTDAPLTLPSLPPDPLAASATTPPTMRTATNAAVRAVACGCADRRSCTTATAAIGVERIVAAHGSSRSSAESLS